MLPLLSITPVRNISATSENQPAAADAARFGPANHTKAGVEGFPVDPRLFDGALRGAHPVQHARSLEGRTRRARDGRQPFAVAQTISPLVPTSRKQGDRLGVVQPGGQHPRGDVRADVAGNAGQAVHCGVGIDRHPDILGPQGRDVIHRGDERRQADALRRDVEQQVHHRAVADTVALKTSSGAI